MKVQSVMLNSANVRYNNANDEEKVYAIEANVNIREKRAEGFDSGMVFKDELTVASFSAWENNVSPNFQGLNKEEAREVSDAIYDFIDSVKANVSTKVIEL